MNLFYNLDSIVNIEGGKKFFVIKEGLSTF
jgi:hypothetical protein